MSIGTKRPVCECDLGWGMGTVGERFDRAGGRETSGANAQCSRSPSPPSSDTTVAAGVIRWAGAWTGCSGLFALPKCARP
jgi:hypothetical protein